MIHPATITVPRDTWTVTPEETAIYYFAWPDGSMRTETVSWINARFGWSNVQQIVKRDVCCARNSAVCAKTPGFVSVLQLPPHITNVIFMDRDVVPTEASDYFLTLDTDIAGCRYRTQNEFGWAAPWAIHLGLCRIKRKVFETLPAPWFQFRYSRTGADTELCECANFVEAARARGFTSAHAGHAIHEPSNSSWGSH